MQAVYITADKCHCCSTLYSTSSPHGGCKYIQYRVAQKSHAANWATPFEEIHKIFILSVPAYTNSIFLTKIRVVCFPK